MPNFYEAVQLLKPYVERSARIADVPLVYEGGFLGAYNTTRYGKIFVDIGSTPWAVSGTDLLAVLTPESKIAVEDNVLVVKRKRSRFKLPLIMPGTYMEPAPMPVAGELVYLTDEDVAVIKRAALFASSNAMHAWAASVTFFCGYVIATNNIALISWKVPSWSEHTFIEPVTVPFWGVEILRPGIKFGLVENKIVFITTGEEHGYICPLDETPPDMMLDFGRKLREEFLSLNWYTARPYKEAFNELAILNSPRFVIDRDKITTEYRPGTTGEAAVEPEFPDCDPRPYPAFMLGREAAQLVFENSELLSFDRVPDRLYFATGPQTVGMCACMSFIQAGQTERKGGDMVVHVDVKAAGKSVIIVEAGVPNARSRKIEWVPYRVYATREEAEAFVAQRGALFRVAEPEASSGRETLMKVTSK